MAVILVVSTGCPGGANDAYTRGTVTGARGGRAAIARGPFKLEQVRSCSTLRKRLAGQVHEQLVSAMLNRWQYSYYRYRHYPVMRRGMPVPTRARRAPSSAPSTASRSFEAPRGADRAVGGSAAGPSHYTKTNNQVVGVDEADRVKTDGRYIYTIHGNQVVIVKSWPARSTQVVARYSVGSGASARQLFVNGDRLVVFANKHDSAWGQSASRWRSAYRGATRVTVLDIKDRAKPRLVAHLDVEGSMLRARMIGTDVYLVSNFYFQLPSRLMGEVNRHYYELRKQSGLTSGSDSLVLLQRAVQKAVSTVPIRQLMPLVRLSHQPGTSTVKPLLDCDDLYLPSTGMPRNLLTLTKLSTKGGPVYATGIVASGMKIYASSTSLYAAASSSNPRNRQQHGTAIHKFVLNRGKGGPVFAASGWVPGALLNQFSMDEHKGHLRVATTETGWRSTSWRWGRRWRSRWSSSSAVFVLKQCGEELKAVGSVRGLAPGERIYAARMIGDKGYLVTFRRTDPLYTLDLSDPKEPVVKGELKVPGFSSYIHPLGKDRLLTVGQDADERGRVKGAHLQIFDVSDLSNPKRTAHYKLTTGYGSSSSIAQWDHHAFTYNARKHILALPLSVYRYHANGGNFNGVVLIEVKRSGFREVGAVDHAQLAFEANCKRYRSSYYCQRWNRYRTWNVPISRSIFIDDNLYTLSNVGLRVNALGDLQELAALTLTP